MRSEREDGRCPDDCPALPEPKDARRLVVIDPEDREQVERLLENYANWSAGDLADYPQYVADMQAALRSLIAPPKPPEPQGLGAVVEDDEGRRYVRTVNGWFDHVMRHLRYDEVPAVKALSEGVTS